MVTCFPRETAARPDFECIAAGYYERWALAMDEDIVILERQQRALDSPLARAGRLSYMEANVAPSGAGSPSASSATDNECPISTSATRRPRASPR